MSDSALLEAQPNSGLKQANTLATATAPAPKPAQPEALPALRQELRLIQDKPHTDGSPRWLIQDPIANKFYQIGWLEFEILSRWRLQYAQAVIQDIAQLTTLDAHEEDISALIQFLKQHQLLQSTNEQDVKYLMAQHQAKQQNIGTWLLHHYLFFRIPLVRPQAWFSAIRPKLAWLFQPSTAWAIIATSMLGLFLVLRQWESFSHQLVDQFTWSGLFGYAMAMVVSKTIHELGHALTATHYGVRVAHMGIAMLVMFPMPYTDTSESWKLTNPKQRLHIASAGIIAELALAGIATLAWSLCSDGALKNALFFLATTSWVLTLMVNLSPFMRFDGYFIFSDWLNFPNLHERSGQLAKTCLRRCLLGLDEGYTETFPQHKRRALIAFAFITWAYRLTVYLGIAWLVYTFFIKVIGIILFTVEMIWFVFNPIYRELMVWHTKRKEIPSKHRTGWKLAGAGLLALALIPWQSKVHAPGWLYATQQTHLYTPIAGQLVSMHREGEVKQGETLFSLTSPELSIAANRAEAISYARNQQLRGLAAVEGGEAKRASITSQRDQYLAEAKLHLDELARMEINAPMNGVLMDLDDTLKPNTWVHPKQLLGVLIDPHSWAVDAFVTENEVQRIAIGQTVSLMVTSPSVQSLTGKVSRIDHTRLSNLPNPLLASEHGGAIATLGDKALTPKQALYRVHITFDQAVPNFKQVTQVEANIHVEAKAWLPDVLKRVGAVLIRESGF